MGHGPSYKSERRQRHEDRKLQRFGDMDQDEDGNVTKDELMEAGRKRFEASDADEDGKASPWEFRASRRLG